PSAAAHATRSATPRHVLCEGTATIAARSYPSPILSPRRGEGRSRTGVAKDRAWLEIAAVRSVETPCARLPPAEVPRSLRGDGPEVRCRVKKPEPFVFSGSQSPSSLSPHRGTVSSPHCAGADPSA